MDDEEIAVLYSHPVFTDEEREQYFSLSSVESAAVKGLAITSRIYCILQLGYFKARQQFFPLDTEEAQIDIAYIHQMHFPDHELNDGISKDTRTKHERIILELCNYRLCGPEERDKLEAKTAQLAKVSSKPIYVFRELMHFTERSCLLHTRCQSYSPPCSHYRGQRT